MDKPTAQRNAIDSLIRKAPTNLLSMAMMIKDEAMSMIVGEPQSISRKLSDNPTMTKNMGVKR